MAKSAKTKAAEGDDSGEAEPAADAKKKSGVTKKSGELKKSTGKLRSVSGRQAAAPKLSGAALVPVVCSECYEELMFDTGAPGDLVCPVCEHGAGRPSDATLHDLANRAGSEKKAFLLAFVFFLVSTVSFGAWAVLVQNPVNVKDGGMFWGTLGPAILCWLLLAIFGAKYEGSRWETYF